MRKTLRELRAWFKLLARGGRYRPTILMYHSVGRNAAHFNVTPEAFRAQMAFLKSHGFEVVSLDECVRRAMAGETGKLVALTFDDGYVDFSENAAPILRESGFPSTVFLIAGRMDALYEASGGVRIPTMSWNQVRTLRAQGVEFGSHTMTHPKLSGLDAAAAREELARSKEAIEEAIGGIDRFWLCYPKGRNTSETRRLAQELGYVGAVTVESGHPSKESDPLGIPRAYVHSEMGMKEFEACLV